MIPMTALKILSEIDYQVKRDLYKNIPDHAITRTKFSDKTANGLTKCIIHFLTLHNCYATRINTTGRYIQGKAFTDVIGRSRQLGGKYIPGTTRRGTADIHAIINGRHVSIEVKVGKDRMSDAQHKTKEAIEKCGGIYWIIKTFEQFIQEYKQIIGSAGSNVSD